MKAIGLIRVSTAIQDLSQQADIVKQEMIKDGYPNDDEHIILIKDKESATMLSEEERHGLNQMKEAIIKDPEINCVYVYELSRISRRLDVLVSVRNFLMERKIQLIVIKPYMRMLEVDGRLSPTGDIMFSIFSGMSEVEGYLRKERTSRGKRKAQLEGKSLGNWLPFGYTVDDNRYIIIDEDEANVVRKIFNMCLNENKSTTVIARELSDTGEFKVKTSIRAHASSILNILKNTAYIGEAPYNKKMQKESHNQYPPIIPKEMFYEVQKLLTSRKKQPKTEHKNIYYCKGLLKDKNSGYILRAASTVASYCFFSDKHDEVQYPSITVPINLFDSFAWHLTIQYNKNNTPVDVEKMRGELLNEIHTLDKKIENAKNSQVELGQQIDRINDRVIFGAMKPSRADEMIKERIIKQEALADDIARWEVESFNKTAYYHATGMVGFDSKDISSITEDEKRYAFIHQAIKEIIVEKGGAPAEYRTKRNGLGVKYGIMEVHYENGMVEEYKFNSYTKRCFTMDDVEEPYEFELRIKGQQHKEGYSLKNKAYRDSKKLS